MLWGAGSPQSHFVFLSFSNKVWFSIMEWLEWEIIFLLEAHTHAKMFCKILETK